MSLASRSGVVARQAIKLATKPRQTLSSFSAGYHTLQAARNASGAPCSTHKSTPTLATDGQRRGLRTVDFVGVKEAVYERSDWPLAKLRDYFKDDTLAVIGYGSQGHGQGLNLRDNGLNVIVGVREGGESWTAAIADGWVPGETLFPIEEAISRGTVIMNLLSDAAQSQTWPKIRPLLTPGKTLYFSHGFSAVFAEDTHVNPPSNIDVILVAPKGSGKTVRTLFKEGRGINSSVAVWQDVTGNAKERAVAMGVGIGSGYLYETTFEKEVYSDLVGERGALMGGLHGLFLAQYNILRENGHSPSEAYNETVEELTQSLAPYLGEHGMDMLHAACSTTARRGALDWAPEFEKATRPVLERLYASVRDGTEARKALEYNGRPTYREDLAKELEEVEGMEIWRVGKIVRGLRPERISQEQA